MQQHHESSGLSWRDMLKLMGMSGAALAVAACAAPAAPAAVLRRRGGAGRQPTHHGIVDVCEHTCPLVPRNGG